MMRSLEEIMFHVFYDMDPNEMIRKINIPNYYSFIDMLDLFLKIHSNNNNPEPNTITVICVNKSSFKTAIKKGFNALYLYDLIDFVDNKYYTKTSIPSFGHVILESADKISYSLIQDLYSSCVRPESTYFYAFYDSYIPRKYLPENDVVSLFEKSYEVARSNSDRYVMSVAIRHLLNALRQKNNTLEECLSKNTNYTYTERIEHFELSTYLDISKPIITPHVSIVKDLNWKIRNYLGLTNQEDPYMPSPGEWLVTERPAIAVNVESGENYTLQEGFRFQVLSTTYQIEGAYLITFEMERPTGEKVKCNVYAAKRYFEYIVEGYSELPHPPYSYCISYGYVLHAFYSVNESYTDGIIIFDGKLPVDKRDLYQSILPIKKNVYIYYNLDRRITY